MSVNPAPIRVLCPNCRRPQPVGREWTKCNCGVYLCLGECDKNGAITKVELGQMNQSGSEICPVGLQMAYPDDSPLVPVDNRPAISDQSFQREGRSRCCLILLILILLLVLITVVAVLILQSQGVPAVPTPTLLAVISWISLI